MGATGHCNETTDETTDGLSELVELVLRAVQNGFIYGYRVRFLHSMAYQLATVKTQTGVAELLGKIWKSVRMGVDHGKVLALFALVYRCTLVVVKRARGVWGRQGLGSHFVAGFVGGVLIYGGLLQRAVRRTAPGQSSVLRRLLVLNEGILTQITMYTLSRLILAGGRDLARAAVDMKNSSSGSGSSQRRTRSRETEIGAITAASWVVTCGLVWGGIMVYYQRDRRQTQARGGRGRSGADGSTKLLYLPRALQVSLEFIYGGVRHAWREAFDYNSR